MSSTATESPSIHPNPQRARNELTWKYVLVAVLVPVLGLVAFLPGEEVLEFLLLQRLEFLPEARLPQTARPVLALFTQNN